MLGSYCKTALDAIVIYRDEKANKWKTLFRPNGFTRPDGVKIKDDELKKLMYMLGDGIVTKRSLEAVTEAGTGKLLLDISTSTDQLVCEEHTRLAGNTRIQDQIIGILGGKPLAVKDTKEKQ